MPTLEVHVANLLIAGEHASSLEGGRWVRDVISFKCGRRLFTFRQREAIAAGGGKVSPGHFVETTTVEVANVGRGRVPEVLRSLEAICWLLSLATQSRVVWYSYRYPKGTSLGRDRSVTGIANTFRPMLELADARAVRDFVERTYPSFRAYASRRRLPVVIDYLTYADYPAQPIEVRLLLAFVTLESLKDSFARACKIPYLKGFYRKPAAKPGKDGAKYTFEELTKAMLADVGMRAGLARIIKLRNQIIHAGVSRMSVKEKWNTYEAAQDIIREYLLRLLNFRGTFFTYSSQGMRPKTLR